MNVMNKVLFSNKEHIQLLCPKLDLDIEFDYNPLNSTNIICVPLFISSSKTPVALLYFENTLSSQQALENCLAQFKEFITFITTLLENFYLFEQNEQLITNLEQKVDEQVEKVRKADQLKKQSEELLEKSSEQSAYATLTRGIAHEIRNPLGMILSGVEILTENLDDREKTMQYLKALKDNILRLSNVTNNMLRFGNPVSKEIKAINLNQIIDSALLLAKGEFKKRNIKIARDLRPVPSVYLDESSISQVILNIILNSIQAIDSNGKITITSSVEQLSTDEGDHSIMLIIHDTGKGISEENLTKIFDPFFTTKYGCTGLGLSTILSIITKYDGNISVDSVENEFTEITITFPVSKLTKKPEPAQTSNTTQ